MHCPRCDTDTPDGAKFCIECGTALKVRCPHCGADALPRAKFCAECGTPLMAQTPAPPAAPPPLPLRYTPGYLAEKILTSRSALEGERKQVTVLLADLKGSMELLVDRDPKEACPILDPVLKHMRAAMHRYEGTVNQVIGDGIMAIFGSPIVHEDHAVQARPEMIEALGQLNTPLAHEGGTQLAVRLVIHTGLVVGDVGEAPAVSWQSSMGDSARESRPLSCKRPGHYWRRSLEYQNS
jgi:Double zinc ribbon/Adenylate and Guanylate cyclase catalytic domain